MTADPNAPSLGLGSISQFAALAAGVIAVAVTTPVVLHALGAGTFGLWVTLVAAVSFTGLLDFGFSQAVGRFLAEYRARRDLAAVHAFIVATGVAYLLVFILVIGSAALIGLLLPAVVRVDAATRAEVFPACVLAGSATASGLWAQFFGSILHAHQRLVLANAVKVTTWLLFTAFTVAAAATGRGIVGLAAALALSAALGCVIQLIAALNTVPNFQLVRPKVQYFRQAISYSVFMFVISAGTAVVVETDTLIIAGFKGVAAVTAYAIALRVTRGLTLFLNKIPDVLFPFYAGMRALGEFQRIRANFLFTARLELFGAAMVVLGLSFAGRSLIAEWVGPAGVASVPVFALAVTLVAMEAMIHPVTVLAAATGGERRMALFNNAEALLNLGLSILFVIRFGVVGVIGATVLAEALTNLWYMPHWAVRSLRMSWRDYVGATIGRAALPAMAGGACGAIVVLVARSEFGDFLAAAVAICVCAAVYLRFLAGADELAWISRTIRLERRAA